jgi:transcriptional regulator with XRE-family HTH domain
MMGYDKKIVGAEIRRRRLAMGLTQEQAAEKIDRALRFYARIELGDVGMSVDTLLEICAMLRTTPDSLLLDHEPNSKLPELDWLTETLSNCTPEQRQTVIELSKVYLRSL